MNEYPQNPPDVEEISKPSFDSLGDAINAGKSDGAAKAREKVPDLKSGVADAMHDLAYKIAYGSVFAGSFLNELIPSNMREGFVKGADAGKTAGQAASEKVQNSLNPNQESGESDQAPNPSFA